jgi:hypothetical protein
MDNGAALGGFAPGRAIRAVPEASGGAEVPHNLLVLADEVME